MNDSVSKLIMKRIFLQNLFYSCRKRFLDAANPYWKIETQTPTGSGDLL